MKDIRTILAEAGISGDQAEKITSEVMDNYRTIKEVEKKESRISELSEQVEALNSQISESAESGAKVEELQALVDDFKAKEKARHDEELEQARRDSFLETFNHALGDRQFINDLMRDTVFEKAYSMCSDTKGLGASDAITAVTKDLEGVWVNPQHDVHKMPGTDLTEKTPSVADTKRSFAKALFGSAE